MHILSHGQIEGIATLIVVHDMALTMQANRVKLSVEERQVHIVGIASEHALQVTSQYKEKFPNDPDINKTIGNIYYHENKIKEALEAYDVYFKEVGDKADLEAQEQYAIMLYAKKDYDKSLELVEKILPKSPEAISLNRLKFYNLMELMQVQGAKAASDTFFGKKYADSLYNATDYKYQGQLAEMMMDTAMMLTAFASPMPL